MRNKTQINTIINFEQTGNLLRIIPLVPLDLANANNYDTVLKKIGEYSNIRDFEIDFSSINSYDSYAVVFINYIKDFAESKHSKFSLANISDEMQSFYSLLSRVKTTDVENKEHFIKKYFETVGKFIFTVVSDGRGFIEFLGGIVIALVTLLFHPSRMRWKDFPFNFTRSGVNAVPIVLLIVFLIGTITGYQGALQLHQFGADKFIADLIGISVVRELSPLMTAIIFAGRSGSAFAAEIGTMKVSEEIDALKTMGFDQFQFLVLPRVMSVMVAIPLVTMLANVSGVAGGLVAALTSVDITTVGYINELQKAVDLGDLLTGLGKSVVFGFMISAVGCFRGLQVTGGAESVGKYTTAAVVTGILLIILSDAVFTILFQILGI